MWEDTIKMNLEHKYHIDYQFLKKGFAYYSQSVKT